MSIHFESVPSNLRTPFVAVEFSSIKAQQGPSLLSYSALLIGQKLAAGAQAADSFLKISSVDQVITAAGRGSMLHRMASAWFANNQLTDVYLGVLADNGAGVAASGTLTVTGPATGAGTISLYLGGTRIPVAVSSGDSANSIAAAINTAINAASDLPVTSAVASAVVTVTFRHKGDVGNQFDMRLNYQDGEALPAGVGVAVVAMASGTTNPTLTNLIAALGDTWFHVIAMPYTDATTLTAIETELLSRWGPTRMIDGVAFTAKSDTLANMSTLGNGRNSKHVAIIDVNSSPTPSMEYAAAVAGVVAAYGNVDPARPFQTLPLANVLPPTLTAQRMLSERNSALFAGISTTKVVGGIVQIDRVITTYKTTTAGSPDTSYLDVNTMLILQYLRFSFRARFASRYPRHKLAADGSRITSGQPIMTPQLGKAESISWARDMEALGLIENVDAFKANVVVERDTTDVNRLNVLLPPDIINQLIVTAAQVQFRL
jgi:phage tail sheath gpL-like